VSVLDDVKARLEAAPAFTKRYSPSPHLKSTRYQLATADNNSACIAYGKELADFVYHAANDIAYLIAALEATERYASELRALYDAQRIEDETAERIKLRGFEG
jgi:hypothetical protein